jgi:glycosyltransferase involved in cell wall biosynthesis
MGASHRNDKTIKVLGIETLLKKKKDQKSGKIISLHSGVDFVRLVQPIKELNNVEGFKTDVIWEYPLDLSRLDWWEDKIKLYDIIYFTYLDNPLFYSTLKMMSMKHGARCVVDLDDNIWGVSKSHYLYEQYRYELDPVGKPRMSKDLYNRTVILKDSDYVTVTNTYLKNKLREVTNKSFEGIEVLPNCIDLKVYDYKKLKPKTSKEFVIAYAGGASHWDDLHNNMFMKAMDTILKKYPNVVFRTTGYYPDLKAVWGKRYQHRLQRSNFMTWVNEVWPEMVGDSDIVIAPLYINQYSRAKSYIKFLEYSAGKRTGVYQKIDCYNEVVKDGENGFLADGTDEWIEKLSILIEDKEKRENMAQKAYEDIKNYQMKNYIDKYASFFRRIVI